MKINGLNKVDFLKRYSINTVKFDDTKLKWEDLVNIFNDYQSKLTDFEDTAIFIFNNLMKIDGVHSVRYRIKDAEHLIEKIIRKKIDNKRRTITIKNYETEITDLIGLRALHLFKDDWLNINDAIREKWDLNEKPTAYYRKGDSIEYINNFENKDCDAKEHKVGYRSVHYIIKTRPTKITYYSEIQVRTIFEEAWSEIDHSIRYPYDQDNRMLGDFLQILNRLSGSADEMGTYVKLLTNYLKENQATISEKESKIKELENKIDQLNIKEIEKDAIKRDLESIKSISSGIFSPYQSPTFNIENYLSTGVYEAIQKVQSINDSMGLKSFEKILDSPTINSLIFKGK